MRTVADLLRLERRVALITGGAGHIGRAACEALAEAGADLAIVDCDERRAEQCATEISKRFGVAAEPFVVDLESVDAIIQLVGRIASRFGRLDVLIHSGAYTGSSNAAGFAVPFAEQTVDAWDRAMRVNLTSAFVLAQKAQTLLSAHKHAGSIILISSIYGALAPQWDLYAETAMQNPAAYGASKGGLIQLGRYLASIMAPRVRVNCLSPGGIARGQDPRFVTRYADRTPLHRMGTEEDLKGSIALLASDASAYITGTNLFVDGGWQAW
jgi:NAD(P)-dependent dehydrogenase (short-subunit alcohol dehydrogenase family)